MPKIARRKLATYFVTQLEAGVSAKKLAEQAVAYLVEERQVGQLELLIRDIEQAAAQRGVVVAHIETAKPLQADATKQISDFVRAAENAREVIVTETETNPELIGGVIVRTPTSVFDGSIRAKLRQLQATTKE